VKAEKLVLLVVVAALVAAFFVFDLGQYFSLAYLKSQQANVMAQYEARPIATVAVFLLVYIAVTALSLPGAAIMTLFAGGIFGLGVGLVTVSFASSIGATLAFLTSRYLLRDSIQRKFGDKLNAINQGIEKEGALYLFSIRMVPAFPFFIVNLVMGLTPIRTTTFYWASQLGMLIGTAVYVNAGAQLATIDSLKGILSPGLLGAFALLGVFPLVAKKIVDTIKARRVYKGWRKPARFDRNLVVIGAGSGGLVTAYIGATVKAKVTLVEKHKMGGDCLNTVCVPSKALIRSAKFLSHARRAHEFGMRSASVDFDFAQVMERVQRVVQTVAPHDSVERYTGLGVECLEGEARITSPWSVEVRTREGPRTLTTRNIVVAAGARPLVPPIPGLEQVGYLTSDTVWSLRRLPKRLVVLGGGPIGCELAQSFARFGADVTQVEMLERLMIREDPEVSAMVAEKFAAEGIRVLTGLKVIRALEENGDKLLIAERDGAEVRIAFDELLLAAGRVANVKGYGLETLGLALRKNGTIETNEYLQTSFPNILAVGDVTGPFQFTHSAGHQAWFAAVNALFGRLRKFKVDYSVMPWATFTEPEVARVGLNEIEARERGIAYEVSVYGIDDLDRAIADSEAHGMVKVLTVPGKDRILGVTIVGEHAGDLIAEFVAAMKHGFGLNKILGTIHVYPTLAEANKFAAGVWKRAHAPAGALRWLERFHRWQRYEGRAAAAAGVPAAIGKKAPA
jgi:pyruvate/2-oxoglutarate dehydrogenase complex dihydrolipoamide dehydrogenase (E3) component/uncharacterized membrane protein YdjX (TVP38/TMEM64 family)